MLSFAIDAAVDAISGGSHDQPLIRLVETAAHIASSPGAMLVVRMNGEDIVLASRGLPFSRSERTFKVLPGTDPLLDDGPTIIPDVLLHPVLRNHPLAVERPNWRWVAIVPVHVFGSGRKFALAVGDPRTDVVHDSNVVDQLQRIATIIADEIDMIGEITWQTGQRMVLPFVNQGVNEHLAGPLIDLSQNPCESQGVVTDFLMSTLLWQRRLLRRGQIPYHGIAKWRTPLKEWQIAALKALKRDAPDVLVERVATQMAEAASALYGTQTFRAVTPVACGHSGPDCLALRLAERIAAKLDVPVIQAFDPLPVSGSSHPRRKRPAMVVREAPDVAILLIDDVATSGAHIEEAASLLRQTAPAVLPLVWIAD